LTLNRSPGFSASGSCSNEGFSVMAGDSDDPEDAAARLEAALERIARLAGSHPAHPAPEGAADSADVSAPVEEIAARLDGLIDRLRAALSSASGGRPG
jgi:hypothetical protein